MSGQAGGQDTAALRGAEPGGFALARGDLDRAADHRGDEAWVAAAWADEATRVVVIDRGQALVSFGDGMPALVLLPRSRAPEGQRFLLGVDASGVAYFGVLAPGSLGVSPVPPPGAPAPPLPHSGTVPTALRQAGPLLSDRDAGLFTQAVALANWHSTHTHCPRCGALTEAVTAGHARRCPSDGSVHFPRIDPAMIVLVTDDQDRSLLARNRRWPAGRVSILAGFVEAGESAEQAVAREVREETGITVAAISYVGSQPWPMPRSLMLGFRAHAPGGQRIRVDDEEIAEARWFTRDELREGAADGNVLLPPPVSIAHQIIQRWYGEALPGTW